MEPPAFLRGRGRLVELACPVINAPNAAPCAPPRKWVSTPITHRLLEREAPVSLSLFWRFRALSVAAVTVGLAMGLAARAERSAATGQHGRWLVLVVPGVGLAS